MLYIGSKRLYDLAHVKKAIYIRRPLKEEGFYFVHLGNRNLENDLLLDEANLRIQLIFSFVTVTFNLLPVFISKIVLMCSLSVNR